MTARREIRAIYDALFAAYGPQRWWPARTCVEIVVGAILTQNTAWTNVLRAIATLRARRLLAWPALRDVDAKTLAAAVRSSGTYRVKAKRLKAFVAWFFETYDGDERAMFATPLETLRGELLSVSGIGPETADAILLYAGGLPTFVVDAYTARVMRRHRVIDAGATYHEVKDVFESALPADVELYNEYHALIVRVGKRHCRSQARCEDCPLSGFPHEPEL